MHTKSAFGDRNHRAKTAFAAFTGLILGFGSVALTGVFLLMRDGRRLGMVLDPMANAPLMITNPEPAWWPVVGTAALTGGILCSLCLAPGSRAQAARCLGVLMSTLAAVMWGIALGPNRGLYFAVSSSESIPPGPPGWIMYASTEPTVLLIAFSALGALMLHRRGQRAHRPELGAAPNNTPTQPEPSDPK